MVPYISIVIVPEHFDDDFIVVFLQQWKVALIPLYRPQLLVLPARASVLMTRDYELAVASVFQLRLKPLHFFLGLVGLELRVIFAHKVHRI